ncbi:hypothetical protein Plec18170_008905 [Paecilomyces lecythidis]
MTPSPSPLLLSSLGETCISYLDSIATNLPISLRRLPDRFADLASRSTYLEPTRSLRPFVRFLAEEKDSTLVFHPPAIAAFLATLAACVLALVAMSWRQPFSSFWRRSEAPPRVNEGDYSYLTNDDIGDSGRGYAPTGDSAPDTIFLKHLRNQYELHFPAYSIDDGLLTVGQLRQRAAEVTGASDVRRVKLLYKGKLLKDDSRPCREEGLKQDSVVMAVLHVQPNDTTSSETSGSEVVHHDHDHDGVHDSQQSHGGGEKKKKNNKKKNKNKRNNKNKSDSSNNLAPPVEQQPSSSGGSSLPSPAPSIKNMSSPLQQADALMEYLRKTLVPLCDEFVANPPADQKAREFEFRKLSETILAQVLLKADSIEPDGDTNARNARRALVKEAQANLNKLDEAMKA